LALPVESLNSIDTTFFDAISRNYL
jgi:hypothetical protein